MFRFEGTIDEALARMCANGWTLVERMGRRGNRDDWIILQDRKGAWGLFSVMSGQTIDGNTETVLFLEKVVNQQGVLF